MQQKYLKNILVTLVIILFAWTNTYVLFANKKKVEFLASQISELNQRLEESEYTKEQTILRLKDTENKLNELISRKQEEAKALAAAAARPKSIPIVPQPIVKPVETKTASTKPAVAKVSKPSRSTRAS